MFAIFCLSKLSETDKDQGPIALDKYKKLVISFFSLRPVLPSLNQSHKKLIDLIKI